MQEKLENDRVPVNKDSNSTTIFHSPGDIGDGDFSFIAEHQVPKN